MSPARTSKRDVVHVVSSGSYSDYRVLCACPTKEAAEALVGRLRGDTESWHHDAAAEELIVINGDEHKVVELRLSTELRDDGTESPGREWTNTRWPFEYESTVAVEWRWVRAPVHQGKGGRLDVHGVDHKRVRTVFSDRRAALLADPAMRKSRELKGRKP